MVKNDCSFPEDWTLVPSTHMGQLSPSVTSAREEAVPSLALCRHLHAREHTHRHTDKIIYFEPGDGGSRL